MDQLIAMAVEINHLSSKASQDNPRERTSHGGRSASVGKSLHRDSHLTQSNNGSNDSNYQIKRTAESLFKVGNIS
jgi:hypothetical protein